MKKRMFLALAVAFALAGCSSVKLDDVPVEDKRAGDVAGPGAGGGQSSVAPVVTDSAATTQAGPANVARLIYFDYDSYVIKPEFQSLKSKGWLIRMTRTTHRPWDFPRSTRARAPIST